jgi:hypothetical protein
MAEALSLWTLNRTLLERQGLLEDFRPEELGTLIEHRLAVRIGLMRGTIHLVSAADCLILRPLTQRLSERTFSGTAWSRNLAGVDVEELMAAGRALLEARPRTSTELGRLLHERWPDREPTALAWAIRCLLPLVQVPPRGVWARRKRLRPRRPRPGYAVRSRRTRPRADGDALLGRIRPGDGKQQPRLDRRARARKGGGAPAARPANLPRRPRPRAP